MTSETRTCQSCKQPFTIEPADFAFYEKMQVPPPTWCPKCRMLRRMGWTGYRILYKRKCDFTGEDVITFYHPSAPYKIYRQDIWWSDKWDPKSYGREYDFSRSFFEQFDELLKSVPLPSLHTDYTTLIDSPYCNGVGDLKNCYLCFQTGGKKSGTENCAYTHMLDDSRDSVDLSFSSSCELCYEVVRCVKCYRTLYSLNCEDCQNVYFSRDCVGCSNCVGCINLRNKNYHIFNKPYAKEEFEKKFKEFDFGSDAYVNEIQKKTAAFFLSQPRKAFQGRKNVNVRGEYILHSKNIQDSYIINGGEDIRYSQVLSPCTNSYDFTLFGINTDWVYESAWVGLNVNTVKFSFWNYYAHHLDYCFGCHGSENLFGCVGIRKGSYCILNKPYAKEEYIDLVERIKKQMSDMPYIDSRGRKYSYGEFFPPDISPWTFNESMASLGFMPLTKEEVERQGFNWREDDLRQYRDATMPTPDHIKDVPDDFTKEILRCETCPKNYQIIPMELEFYRRMRIPIPRHCPLCRERARIKQLNPIAVYDRICTKCGVSMKTSYAPERPEIVYCEQCYNAEVV